MSSDAVVCRSCETEYNEPAGWKISPISVAEERRKLSDENDAHISLISKVVYSVHGLSSAIRNGRHPSDCLVATKRSDMRVTVRS